MRKQLAIWLSALGIFASLWVVAVQTQAVQCGGSFVPSLNCTVSGKWYFTNITTAQGPIPFQARDQNNTAQDVTGIISRVTDLTNTQVLALNVTPVTVVPAPGAGFYVDVISVNLVFNYTAAYTNGSDLRLFWGSRGTGNAASAVITVSGLIVSVSADAANRVSGVPDNTDPPTTNLPVVIQQTTTTVFATGDAANLLRVVVNYRIVKTGL